ncbi:enoyl-CoA hydratase/isomerase family protein [Halococcus sediminicola]|uniref:enoyl-CoA hydratase/isomerase family protein n=1 Tax=Halococcus sediminicola TaxID=1264579 RepID=UPI00067922D9|nr:enoyl-CoA hydratase-related protein [Halococcus sediminicola]
MSSNDLAATDANFEHVRVEVDQPVEHAVTIVFDRPEARNAMNATLNAEAEQALEAIEDSRARVIVLTGSDEASTFVAGADVAEMKKRTPLEQRSERRPPRLYERIENHPLPTVAQINGHALGGGCELALACDVRIASADSLFGFPEITLGLIPGGGGTQRLPRLVGQGKAMELVLSGDMIDAAEAAEIKLIERVADPDTLNEAVTEFVEAVAANSPVALSYAKQAIQASSRMGLSEGVEHEFELFIGAFSSDDASEGIAAFTEDREPEWTGR